MNVIQEPKPKMVPVKKGKKYSKEKRRRNKEKYLKMYEESIDRTNVPMCFLDLSDPKYHKKSKFKKEEQEYYDT